MKRLFVLFAFAMLLSPAFSFAANELMAQQSIEIDAPAKKVWDIVKNFDSLQKWHPAFKNDVIKSGKNNKKGAMRTLTLGSGESFDEELLEWSGMRKFYRYRIVGDSPFPLTDYVSTVAVQKGKGGKSKLTWQGKFKNKEGSGKTDAEVVELINGAYKAGVENVKTLAEKK